MQSLTGKEKVIVVHQWMAGAEGDWKPWLKITVDISQVGAVLPILIAPVNRSHIRKNGQNLYFRYTPGSFSFGEATYNRHTTEAEHVKTLV